MNQIEDPEIGSQVHGVAGFERDAVRLAVGGRGGREFVVAEVRFRAAAVAENFAAGQPLGRSDEGAGKIDADDLTRLFRQFEGRPTDRAADIQRAFEGRPGRIEHFGDRGHRESEKFVGERRAGGFQSRAGEDFPAAAVVEKQVGIEEAILFVGVHARTWLRHLADESRGSRIRFRNERAPAL